MKRAPLRICCSPPGLEIAHARLFLCITTSGDGQKAAVGPSNLWGAYIPSYKNIMTGYASNTTK
jgi:hypothetical protein